MTHPSNVICEWTSCKELAAKHVRFCYRIFEPEEFPIPHDLALCDSHIAEIRRYFQVVRENELWDDKDGNSTFRHAA